MEQDKFEELILNTMLSFRNELETQLGLNKTMLIETLARVDRIEQYICHSGTEFMIDSAGLQDMAETLGL